jgi:glucosylceramidase
MADSPSGAAFLVVTTEQAPFQRSFLVASARPEPADITVHPERKSQAVEAFGGAFNEHGWAALSVLDETERHAVLRAIFHPQHGLRFNWCRTAIGASDYALDRYTLNESVGDFSMASFSIAPDRRALIPYIKAAQELQPNLKLWASAWTPPTWMKTNGAFDGGAMQDDPRVYEAYALYLAKFVLAYAAEGIPVTMVVPQNEPGQLTDYPSCDWSPEQYRVFLRDHLGPLFRRLLPSTKLFAGTINRAEFDLLSVLNDPAAAAHIDGVCLQWSGLELAGAARAAAPSKPIMQSETDCGNWHWQPGFDPEHAANDFAYGAYTWRKYRDFFAAGCSSYMLWNMVLDEHGKNIDAKRPWPQNSAVVVNRVTKQVVYTPMFWATKHFSGLVDIGARLIGVETNDSTNGGADVLAFVNPDGSVLVELLNELTTERSARVAVGASVFDVSLPPRSFATVVVPA